jgi:glycosyltransferase involved in cell wall biosynthesis
MSPRVSVVIPVFNRPGAVRCAIDSVLAQTFQDFEVIVVDDGSTDQTAAAVRAVQDPRIRLVRHDQRRGGSAARNSGIRASTAPYVAFLDSDDEWLPSKLERQLQLFEGRHDLGLVYTGADWVYPDGSTRTMPGRRYPDLARRLLTANVIGETSLGMVPRHVLDQLGGFDETLPSSQDLDLWLRICQRFSAEVDPDPLVKVTKSDDRGRITNDFANGARGRDLFCAKHRVQMINHGVLHEYLRTSGWRHHRTTRNPQLARHFYLQSIRANRFALSTYALWLMTFVPMWCLDLTALLGRLSGRLSDSRPELPPSVTSRSLHATKLHGNAQKDSATS